MPNLGGANKVHMGDVQVAYQLTLLAFCKFVSSITQPSRSIRWLLCECELNTICITIGPKYNKGLICNNQFYAHTGKMPKRNRPLACMFCFPNSDHVMFFREFVSCFFMNYAYICMCMYLHGVPSRGLKWENKTYRLKRSITINKR